MKILVVKIMGGLGNQMFQYAIAYSLARKIECEMKLDLNFFDSYKTHKYSLTFLNITALSAKKFDTVHSESSKSKKFFSKLLGYNCKKIIREKSLLFDPSIFELEDNIYLDGYWQSEHYFKDYAVDIRKEFSFKHSPSLANEILLGDIVAEQSVSVHIRRGDYVSDAKANAVHGTCDDEYYQRAVSYMHSKLSNKLKFYIFSDDPQWVRENMNFGESAVYVTHNDAEHNFEDLRLMSACKHHIIANSSFSWWAAWLNPSDDKIIVAPKQWFKTTTLDSNDIVPDNWIRL